MHGKVVIVIVIVIVIVNKNERVGSNICLANFISLFRVQSILY